MKTGIRAGAVLVLALGMACSSGKASMNDQGVVHVRERDVAFTTSDGRRLTGRLFGSGTVGVTLAHMYPADATSWYSAARKIAAAGYTALAFNFRGFDGSQGSKIIPKAPIDLEAARNFLQEQGAKRYAFVGASMGGTASIIGATTLDPLAVVTLSAPLRFLGLDAAPASGQVQRPVLLMASQDDQEAMQAIGELQHVLPNFDTKVYEGAAHGTDILNARPEAIDEIIKFLVRWVPPSEPEPTKTP